MLQRIVERTRHDLELRKLTLPFAKLTGLIGEETLPSFAESLASPKINVIAEIKYRSPSHGSFECRLLPEEVARQYVENGAVALSVLTDEPFFGGRLDSLRLIRDRMSPTSQAGLDPEDPNRRQAFFKAVPLLRKDFILDRYQVAEARFCGASAFLLIVACLDRGKIEELLRYGQELGLDGLVEVHDPYELEVAVESGSRVIGVNNRNLSNFEVDLGTSFDVARRLEGESRHILVAESGISTRGQMEELRDAGFHAFLIGTSLMSARYPGDQLARLLGG